MRIALRTLLRSPAFALTTIATIALSAALAATAFAIVDGVLFRPLPFPDAERLVTIAGVDRRATGFGPFAPADVRYLQEAVPSLPLTTISTPRAWRPEAQPERQLYSVPVAANFFEVLGQRPLVGGFTAEHFRRRAGADHLTPAIVSYVLWRDRMGGRETAVGATLDLVGARFRVVGVLPQDFVFPAASGRTRPDILVPLIIESDLLDRWSRYLFVVARAPSGLPTGELQVRLDAALSARADEYPPRPNQGTGPYESTRIRFLTESLGSSERPLFRAAFAGAALLILLGCVNVAGLLIARYRARERDLAVRASLGASRRSLARLIVTEAAIIATAGAIAGVAAAKPILALATRLLPPTLLLLKEPLVDRRVVGFAVAAAVGTMLPIALLTVNGPLKTALRSSLSGLAATVRVRSWARFAVLAAESGIGIALVIAGSLSLASFVTLRAEDPGFDRSHLIVLDALTPGATTAAEQQARLDRIPERLAAVPAVTGVARAFVPLLESAFPGSRFKNPSGARVMLNDVPVSEDFFSVAGLELLAGRLPTRAEITEGRPVAVVSKVIAESHWPGGRAVGQTLSGAKESVTIIGVVEEAHFGSQADQSQYGEVYLSALYARGVASVFLVRTERDLESTARDARSAVNSDVPGVLVRRSSSLERALSDSVMTHTFRGVLFGTSAGAGLLLLAVGVGGIVAMGVARQRREVGIRTALGARRADISRMVVGDHLRPVIIGAMLGLLASWWVMRLLSTLLYQIDPHDALIWAIASLAVIGVAALAAWVPAYRAGSVDPAIVLRAE